LGQKRIATIDPTRTRLYKARAKNRIENLPVETAVFPIAGSIGGTGPNSSPVALGDALREIVDKPALQFALEEALRAGARKLVFVTAPAAQSLRNEVAALCGTLEKAFGPLVVEFVEQPSRRGLGHAILCAREAIGEGDFAVLIPNLLILGDSSGLQNLIQDHVPGTTVIGTTERPLDKLQHFGVVEFEPATSIVQHVSEKPHGVVDQTSRASFGRWLFGPQIWQALEALDRDGACEVSLTAALNLLLAQEKVGAVPLRGLCFDLRQPEGVAQASYAYALLHPEYSSALIDTQRDFFSFGVSTLRSRAWVQRYEMLTPLAVLAQLIEKDFAGKIALVSSFGAESATLLHMASRISKDIPVLFIDTGKLFPETLRYRDDLVARLGLRDVRSVKPATQTLHLQDPDGTLFDRNPDLCCDIRKTLPLKTVLAQFDCWISGRKRFQNSTRQALELFEEEEGGRLKVNPLYSWTKDDLERYATDHDLPQHPLVAQGYPSIGCEPCTSPVAEGEDERAGRWRGLEKTECGIHLVDGKIVRTNAPNI
jgi:phosphoadenosine phosphosulfate reductase